MRGDGGRGARWDGGMVGGRAGRGRHGQMVRVDDGGVRLKTALDRVLIDELQNIHQLDLRAGDRLGVAISLQSVCWRGIKQTFL